ncbi:MAG: electron transfer flavoprotein subunit alpha/FixB family protein [Planctomycetota bacterium]|nr:MAG: electron transfer flavoprotein subunit alpha/FixB family protein [Planctomycetota bacterium]
MKILVVAEHDHATIRTATRSAITFARQIAEARGGSVACLVVGSGLENVAADAARLVPVLAVDDASLAEPTADRYARLIADVVVQRNIELLVAAASTFAKDVVSRAGGLLGGCMASDVIGHEFRDDELLLKRPMYAGAVTATVTLHGAPQIITVRGSAYPPAEPATEAGTIEPVAVDAAGLPGAIEFVGRDEKQSSRPDVSEASIVVSGGRAMKNSEDFERLVGTLADAVGGATGSSRALVDAGITPNEYQVGQTGKIIAPELYIALGISGAVQHLAGMKNSKVIVAINKDPDAPIFEMADYGLVGDVYEIVPQMIEKLR